jgi:hypothetical protein
MERRGAHVTTETEARLILTIDCPTRVGSRGTEPEFQLNSTPIPKDQLPYALRAALSRRSKPVLYLRGEGCVAIGEIVRVIDVVRGAWYGLPIVLLTSEPGSKSQP